MIRAFRGPIFAFLSAIFGCNGSNVQPMMDKLEAQPEVLELGEVKADIPLKTQIKLKNMGTSQLVIEAVSKACVCTTASVDVDVINPNQSCNLCIEIRPNHSATSTSVSIYYVDKNGKQNALRVPILWKCEGNPPFGSNRLDFGKLAVGSDGRFSEPIESMQSVHSGGKIRLKAEPPNLIDVSVDEQQRYAFFRVRTSESGHFQATVRAILEGNSDEMDLSQARKDTILKDTIVTWAVADARHVRLISGVFHKDASRVEGRLLALASSDLDVNELIISVQPSDSYQHKVIERNTHSCWIVVQGQSAGIHPDDIVVEVAEKATGLRLISRKLQVAELLKSSDHR